MHSHVPPNLLPRHDLFVQHSRRPPAEPVTPLLLLPHVGRDVVAQQRCLLRRDDADIHIRAGTQVVEDAGLDGLGRQPDGLVPTQARLPLGLEDGHGGQGARAHGDVGQLVGAAVGVHGEEGDAGGVDAGNDEVGANVALVAEEVLLQHRHARDDAGPPACG